MRFGRTRQVAAVEAVGGEITHELGIINAVGARLTTRQRSELGLGIRSYENAPVKAAAYVTGDTSLDTYITSTFESTDDAHFPKLTDADQLHDEQVDGRGIGIAVVDTGIWGGLGGLAFDPAGDVRVPVAYNAITNKLTKHRRNQNSLSGDFNMDGSGHGSHMSSVSANSTLLPGGDFAGIAPAATLVPVKAFNNNGQGTYADVIRGLDWVYANKSRYNVRVVNLSFSAQPQSHYWEDPINQAVMKLWRSDVVVVASAGNTGPDPMTIGVPGNLPYIITVGATTDNYTPDDPSDDRLTSFSSAGPTYEAFVKPDVVAPGGHILGEMNKNSTIAQNHLEFHDQGKWFLMSGTSQATAAVSGIVALMLQRDEFLSPDEIKYRLMASARPAVDASGNLAYTVFQQGAGAVNAYDAVYVATTGYANQGLDIDADLDGTAHFQGRANRDADGNYYIEGLDGYMWNDGFMWNDSFMWSDSYMWSDSFMWSDSLTESMSINVWVDQQ